MIQDYVQKQIRRDDTCDGLYHLINPPKLLGISTRYLENAEEDFSRFVNFEHPFWAIRREINQRGFNLDGALVIDIASGFGNTVIPMLIEHQTCTVIASDLSEQILRILLREAGARGLGERVAALVCDGQDDLWKPGCADLVVGGAALHHMIDPSLTISAALHSLKPGGSAIFLEPMEIGHVIMGFAFQEILRLPELAGKQYKNTVAFIVALSKDIEARTHHATGSTEYHWEQLDDKWLFSTSYLIEIAERCNCTLSVSSLQSLDNIFTIQATTALQQYGNLKCPECLPEEGWEILRRFDKSFSTQGRADIPLEAALVFSKRH